MEFNNLDDIRREIEKFIWPNEDARQRLKRERILLAATELFVQQGYRKTSMDEVARLAGVAKGTLYLYYRNKAELVYHAIALEKRNHVHRLEPLMQAMLSPRERLGTWIALGIVIAREMPLTTSLVQGNHEIALALGEMDDAVLEDTNFRQLEILIRLLGAAADQSLDARDLEVRSQVLMDLVFSVTTSGRLNAGGVDWPEYVATLAGAIVNGVLSVEVSVNRTLLDAVTPDAKEISYDRSVSTR